MNLLMIAPQPFFEPRGTPISVSQRLYALSASGHKIDLATYHIGADKEIPGVTIYRIPRVPFIRSVKVGPSWAKPVLDFLLLLLVIKLLWRGRYDVIHSHEEAAFFAMPLARLFKVRHVYDMHSSLPKQLQNFAFGNYRPLIWLFTWLEHKVLYSCDMVLTVGQDLEQLVQQINPQANQYRIENIALHTSHNGRTPAQTRPQIHQAHQQGKPLIVYTGTFERYQGLDLLLQSAPLVWQQQPEAQFVLVGGKPRQIEQQQTILPPMPDGAAVHFVGTVSPEVALAYLDMAAILVSPRVEGTSVPLKIYSYLHAGKPIVATRLPAHEQVLSDETAYLVQPTKESLAQGILAILHDVDLGRRLGAQAHRLAQEQYSFSQYQQKMDTAYQSLLSGE